MIAKYLKMLAGFIVEAAFAKLGIENLDDLLTRGMKALRSEFSDELAKVEEIPNAIVTQLGDIPEQVVSHLPDFRALINQAMGRLPFPFNQFQI